MFLVLVKRAVLFCLVLIGSWIVVHFMALFGIFLVIAIPIFHLVFYPKIICFWCQIKHTPHTAKHSLIDSLLILFLTALSLPVVYLESRLIRVMIQPISNKTAEFVIPSKNQYKLREIFPLKIEIKGIKSPVNVIQADLSFDPKKIEVVDISTDESFAKFFVQKDINNTLGYTRLTGGVPNPGYSQDSGIFGTVYLRGISPGLVTVTYLDSSLALANDGKGTNILKNYPQTSYVILPELIPLEDQKMQEKLTIQKQVLGDESNQDTLTFYEYSQDLPKPYSDILGTETESLAPTQSEQSSLLDLLAKLDEKIISFWDSIKSFLIH